MKKLALVLSAVMIVASAAGQRPTITLKGVPTRPKPPIVRMAHKPLILSKGGVPTPAEKAQFIASARAAFKTPAPGSSAKPMATPAPATSNGTTTETITVAQPTGSGDFTMAAYNVGEWDPDNAGLLLNLMFAPNQSNLGFNVNATANNLYVLTFKVYTYGPSQFSITTAPDGTAVGAQPTETVNVPQGTTGFAYAFDAASTGGIWIQVSSNGIWEFQSAELTTAPM